MWSALLIKEIVRILMGSRCYFDLDLRERHDLIKYLLREQEVRELRR